MCRGGAETVVGGKYLDIRIATHHAVHHNVVNHETSYHTMPHRTLHQKRLIVNARFLGEILSNAICCREIWRLSDPWWHQRCLLVSLSSFRLSLYEHAEFPG